MNIFTTSSDPEECAIALDDKRCKHMPKECFEMISIALYYTRKEAIAPFIIWNREVRTKPDKFQELLTNKCTQWVASKRENISWLWFHSIALMEEYRYRFNQIHYLYDSFIAIKHYVPISGVTPRNWPNASGYEEATIFDSYKRCLTMKWFTTDEIRPVIWTSRSEPKWTEKYKSYTYQGDLFRYNPGTTNNIPNDDPYDDLPF